MDSHELGCCNLGEHYIILEGEEKEPVKERYRRIAPTPLTFYVRNTNLTSNNKMNLSCKGIHQGGATTRRIWERQIG